MSVSSKDDIIRDRFSEIEENFISCFLKNNHRPLKVLLGLYKGNYYRFALACLFFMMKHCCVWVLPVVTANIINIASGQSSGDIDTIVMNIVLILALVAINYPMNYLFTKYRSRAVRSVEAGLRGALVRKLQQLSITYHNEMQSGRLQSKVMRDVEAVETLSEQLFVNMLTIFLNLAVSVIVTGMKSYIVLLFFAVCAPSAALTIVAFRKKVRESNSEFRKEMEETSAKVMEMVELIPITRAHALENLEINKMEDQLERVAESGYRLDIVQANFGAVGWCVFQAFQVLCLGFTGIMAYKGRILVGDITLYQTYFTIIVGQIAAFINLLPIISKGIESVNSVGEILLANDIEENDGKEKLKSVECEFEFKDIKFAYDKDKPVLNGLSLNVKKGETIALDSISEREIQKALDNLTSGRTTFVVAHRLSTIRNADKIAVVCKGKCTEFGTYDELMELHGEFYEMRKLQIE